MRRLLSTFLHILSLDTKPAPPPAPEPPVPVDALLDLALVMRDRWEGTALSGPGYESHGLVAAALNRIFPGDVHTVERCAVPECQLNGCDECATDAQVKAGDAKLTAFLASMPRPALQGDPATDAGGQGHRLYIASKTAHAPRWRHLRDTGLPIVSTWIDEAGVGETADFEDLWRRCVAEAASARALIVFREPGEVLKGAFVEVGAALAAGVPVFAVGCNEFSFVNHALVTPCASIEEAIAAAYHVNIEVAEGLAYLARAAEREAR